MYDEPFDMNNPMEDPKNQDQAASQTGGEAAAPLPMEVVSDEEIEEVSDSIFNGFQIVRSEFFSQLREPAITFCQGRSASTQPASKSFRTLTMHRSSSTARRKCWPFAPARNRTYSPFSGVPTVPRMGSASPGR